MPTAPSTSAIDHAVAQRYSALSSTCDSLSCGKAMALANPTTGETVVDLGCGRGRDVLAAATLVGTDGQVVGVDGNIAMIEAAQASVPPDVVNVRFVRGDLSALDLPDAFAHVATSNCAINHAVDKAAVYREIHRILRPGGRCVVSDIVAETTLPESVRSDPAAWAACYGGAIPQDDYLAAIRAAGFATVEILSRSQPYEKGGVHIRSLTIRATRA